MLKKIKAYYNWGGRFLTNQHQIDGENLSALEVEKKPLRSEVINFLLSTRSEDSTYLEIGVRNPNDNFNKINASKKFSVDPGVEFKENPVDFKLTSDDFFSQLKEGTILDAARKFDVIFIDGLHLADQVEKDILNSLDFIKDDGFIVMHDCNPPSEWHARERYGYDLSPARNFWNGTTWKAFVKARKRTDLFSCCVDSDWGIGVISKKVNLGQANICSNEFYEYDVLAQNRIETLNLVSFEALKTLVT
jgi:hypothetical protein